MRNYSTIIFKHFGLYLREDLKGERQNSGLRGDLEASGHHAGGKTKKIKK